MLFLELLFVFFFEELEWTVFDDVIRFVFVSGIKRETYVFIIFRLNPRRDRGNNLEEFLKQLTRTSGEIKAFAR